VIYSAPVGKYPEHTPVQSALLHISDLACERDDRELFAGLSLRASGGDIVQVAGANGSGKTTLIRALAGLFGGFTGTIDWPLYRQQGSDPREQMLYLGHRAGLRDELTARENLRWWCALHRCASSGTDAALAMVGLAGFEDVPVQQLSAGQRRRVMLSLLWSAPKQVWLLDEPFTALASDGVTQVEARIREHAAGGGLVLYSSHHRLDADVRHVRLGQMAGEH
jgi:heme exporter protein A